MEHTFYGPWRIIATCDTGSSVREGFEIRGSSGFDNFYETSNGANLDFVVDGEEWTCECRAMLPFENPEWFDYDGVKQTGFRPPDGLSTRLAFSEEGVTIFVGPFIISQVLWFISMDPAINPPLIPNPFDFTLVEG